MATVNASHSGGGNDRSSLGVIGTLGTSDTGGTALTLSPSLDATTGAQYVSDIGGTVTYGTFLGTVSATAGTTVQGTITGLAPYKSFFVFANLKGVGGTSTTDVYLQTSPDGLVTWVDYAHFAQLATGATALRAFTVSKGAHNPSAPSTVGTGSVPALGAGSVVGGDFGDTLRIVTAVIAGGTNAGTILFNFSFSK